MRYMDVLWTKIENSYSKWPPLARTQALNLCGRSSIELRNTSTGKYAAAFLKDRFKLSILGSFFLQHPVRWKKLELPAGLSPWRSLCYIETAMLSPNTQATDNPAVAGDECSGLHLHFRLAFCKSVPKPLGPQTVAQSFRRWLTSRAIPILKV